MHGLFGVFGVQPSVKYEFNYSDEFIRRNLQVASNLSVWQVTHNKFLKDKVFVNSERYFYVTEGILFNVKELCQLYCVYSLTDLIPVMYERQGKFFFNLFRGTFCGIFFDKEKNRCIVFNDHIGDKMLFYFQDDNAVWFGADLGILTKTLRSNGCRLHVDISTMYAMLSYGYSPNAHTLIDGIVRVPAGACLEIDGENKATLIRYHTFLNNANSLSEQENIERLDVLFRQAVQRVLDKNDEYGYANYMPLSAGLDSRMTVWVARQLTQNPIINITYSQSGYYDETVAKSIACYLGNQMIFKPLDGGLYLSGIDDITTLTNGLVNYGGAAQVWDTFKDLPVSQIGVVATGMYGDSVVRTVYTQKNRNQMGLPADGAISHRWVESFSDKLNFDFMSLFPNMEIRYLYIRGFNCAYLGSPLVIQHVAESYSPFSDVDFMEFVYSIPLEQRWGYDLYDKWVLCKYPDAAKWLHNGARKIGVSSKNISICGRSIPLKDIPLRGLMYVIKKMHLYNYEKIRKGHSMNPLDSWLAENKQLNDCLQTYFDTHISLLDACPDVQKNAIDIFQNGIAMEKCSVLTLLGAIKLLEITPDEYPSHN